MEKTADAANLAEYEWVLAIDPGASGGIARFWGDDRLETWRMPTEAAGGKLGLVKLLLDDVFSSAGCRRVVIENVWGREGDGKRQITTFMKHVGFLEGVITVALYKAIRAPRGEAPAVVWVPATKWQKDLGCPKAPTKKEETKASRRKTIHKNRLKEFAEGLFPDVSFTLCTSDAALLAEWGRRTL